MADSSPQSTLLKSIGAYGGIRVTGESLITGNYMAVMAMTDTTILGSTQGNVGNLSGVVVVQGATLLGDWNILHTSGDCIIYNG